NHGPAGGSSMVSTSAETSALFVAHTCGPKSGAFSWLGGASQFSRHSSDHMRSVSGGRPAVAHAHGTQTCEAHGACAVSWSVYVDGQAILTVGDSSPTRARPQT